MACAKFLHTADLHLSRSFGFLPPHLAEERRRDQRKALTRIADLAIERDVDLVLIAGDAFDSPDPDPTDLEAAGKEFSRLTEAGKRVFAIPGNHDHISRDSLWDMLNLYGVNVFLKPEWENVILDDCGISISGTAFDKSKSERRAFEGLEIPSGMPSVVLLHASYEVFEGQVERYHPFSASELTDTGASYVALGHYHRFNCIPAGGVVACYPGTPEGISFDSPETGDRSVIVGEITDGGVAIEPVKINSRTMKACEVDCTTFDSQMSLFNYVRKLCEPNSLVRINLTGSPNSDVAAGLSQLAGRFKESSAYLSIDSSGLLLPTDLPADDRTIRGRFCKHMLGQIEASTDPERKRQLSRALELGLAAFSED